MSPPVHTGEQSVARHEEDATDAHTARRAAPSSKPWTKRLGVERFSAVYLLVGFFLFFGITQSENFLAWDASVKLVLTEKAVIVVIALAFLVPFTAQTYDLSVGHMMSFSLVLVTSLSKDHGMPEIPAALIAMSACALVGFISGFFVVRLRVNSFIATLGMSQLLAGVSLKISDNRQITDAVGAGYRDIGRNTLADLLGFTPPGGVFGYPFHLPLYVWYMILVATAVWYVLEHTPIGRYLFATGGNPDAARLAGIRTDLLTWGSLVASAVLAGFAGIIWSWRVGNFANSVGPGFLFPAVAAVFFGASQLRGRPNVWGTLLAVYALAFGVKGIQLSFSNPSWVQPIFEGASLLIAVSLAARHGIIRVRRRNRYPAPAGDAEPTAAVIVREWPQSQRAKRQRRAEVT